MICLSIRCHAYLVLDDLELRRVMSVIDACKDVPGFLWCYIGNVDDFSDDVYIFF